MISSQRESFGGLSLLAEMFRRDGSGAETLCSDGRRDALSVSFDASSLVLV